MSGPLILAVPVAAAAGAITFISPCCLPLIPGYLSYVTGMSGADAEGRGALAWDHLLRMAGHLPAAVYYLSTLGDSAFSPGGFRSRPDRAGRRQADGIEDPAQAADRPSSGQGRPSRAARAAGGARPGRGARPARGAGVGQGARPAGLSGRSRLPRAGTSAAGPWWQL